MEVNKGLIPNVPIKAVRNTLGNTTRYANFHVDGQVKEAHDLPEKLWLESDANQFRVSADLIGGRPEGDTWHHPEVNGVMELVPTGIHDI